ncbi:MAG: hypothetical protein M3275_16570 [Thermoproteota archaeon]|nr:hypothetical protein [Thermoproteota archaeon]
MFENLFGGRGARARRARTIGEWTGRRFWESRQFYSAYIALFIAVSNWITIQYRLLLENIPIFNALFSQLWIFLIVAVVLFTVVSILGGHYIHRKRQFRLEQAVAIEENPYLYRSAPGKERNLMIPIGILQLEAIEAILNSNNSLTEEKKKQIEAFRQDLIRLSKGLSIGDFRKTADSKRVTTPS